MSIKIQLSENLKKLMYKKMMTLKKLALSTKIPVSTLSTYLSGSKSSYNPIHLHTLSKFFGVSIDFLLFSENAQNKEVVLDNEQIIEGYIRLKVEKVFIKESKT